MVPRLAGLALLSLAAYLVVTVVLPAMLTIAWLALYVVVGLGIFALASKGFCYVLNLKRERDEAYRTLQAWNMAGAFQRAQREQALTRFMGDRLPVIQGEIVRED